MLFNSYAFLFHFLPLTLSGFLLLFFMNRKELAFGWLTLTSLYFYSHWNLWNLPLLLASVAINFHLGRLIGQGKRLALYLGIGFNLLLLGWFKYISFVTSIWGGSSSLEIALPLAISFFTFQQIAYLVDIHRQIISPFRFPKYLLFVSFFPHLIAGPIMHYREMMPQFTHLSITRTHLRIIGLGVMFFSIGLFKKVVMADHFAAISDPAFANATTAQPLGALEAWQGMLAYTFQIYFDFSGYAEMAIGLGLLFGIWLPINFNSPYKANSIVDFWRRWHITLSNFLRDYLYIPLGGNRTGQWRQATNLLVTMLLAGLWHGAGWTFVLWGGLHGLLLMVNHRLPVWHGGFLLRIGSILMTFLLVAFLWILFRAETLAGAWHFFVSLWQYPDLSRVLDEQNIPVLGWLLAGFTVIWGLPGTLQWLHYARSQNNHEAIHLHAGHGFLAGIMLFVSLKMMASGPSQSFIYFVF
jgi:D-alanyl-lipoteichoic acid acyltransferase DltB (MBOAT superfamily)